jgi:hypothetical protein
MSSPRISATQSMVKTAVIAAKIRLPGCAAPSAAASSITERSQPIKLP